METIKLNKSQFIKIDNIRYMFFMSNSHINYAESYPRKVKKILKFLFRKERGKNQLIKKYNWAKKNGLDWKIEFQKAGLLKRALKQNL